MADLDIPNESEPETQEEVVKTPEEWAAEIGQPVEEIEWEMDGVRVNADGTPWVEPVVDPPIETKAEDVKPEIKRTPPVYQPTGYVIPPEEKSRLLELSLTDPIEAQLQTQVWVDRQRAQVSAVSGYYAGELADELPEFNKVYGRAIQSGVDTMPIEQRASEYARTYGIMHALANEIHAAGNTPKALKETISRVHALLNPEKGKAVEKPPIQPMRPSMRTPVPSASPSTQATGRGISADVKAYMAMGLTQTQAQAIVDNQPSATRR